MQTTILNIERGTQAAAPAQAITVIHPLALAREKLKVAAYARVSSDSEDQRNSYISQVRHYTALINGNEDWEYVDVYADEGLSGLSADKRPDFQRMLADCRKGLIDKILCKSVSRFARNFSECMAFIHELKLIGVTIIFDKENIDTAKMSGELMLAMQANKAQKESISIAGNMRRGVQMRMKTGNFLPSSTPYGYALKNRTLEVVPEQAAVVRQIYAAYLTGHGAPDIAEALNRAGVPRDAAAERWNRTTIQYLLTNISYTGDMLWQKTFATDEVPFKNVKNNGEKNRYLVRNNHPPIISHEDFEAVQRLITARGEQHNARTRPAHLLSQKVYCGECGTLCRRRVTRGIGYWLCRQHDAGKEHCPARQVPEAEILAAFQRMRQKLKHHAGDILLPMLEQLRQAEDRRYRGDMKISEVNKELSSLVEQVLVLERLEAKGYAEPALFMSKKNELDRQIDAMRVTKRRLMEQAADGGAALATENIITALERDGETDECFTNLVERVTIISQTAVKFRLHNGLELTENIEGSGRVWHGKEKSLSGTGCKTA